MTHASQTLPANYKQTEIGMIPEDWDVKKLGKACEKITTGKLDANAMKKDGEYRFYTCAKEYYFIDKYAFDTEALLVSGNGANVGYIHYYKGKFNAYQRTYVLSDFKENIFLTKLLLDKNLKERIRTEVNAGNTPYITMGTLTEMNIAYPTDPTEQTAIATALSDTDALIENLEKLIAKKKAIKQGAMQQLITGKKRLPGFSGEWVRKKIGDIGEITGSGVDKKTSPDELPVRLVNFLNVYHQSFIYSKDLNHLVTARPDQITRCSVKKGDVFFTPSSEMPYDVGLSAVAMENMPDVVYSYHVDRLRLFEDWDILFRAYIFQTKDFSDQTAAQCEGSGKRYVLNLTTFRERLTVYYPTDKNEQIAIATILSDMDAEIEKLENKLGKYRQIKTGMMQQLLTGKIRLLRK
jgi:type I restriction enzyme S subunit